MARSVSSSSVRALQVATATGWTPRAVRIALLTLDRRDFPGAEGPAAERLRVVRDPLAPSAAVEDAVVELLRLVEGTVERDVR